MIRPGAALLVSLVAGERRGRPGPARDAALAAARADPASATAHLFDAVYALLVAGESRAAGHVLDEIEGDAGPDPLIARRVHACRAWASQLERNWYPGDIGAELTADPAQIINLDEASPGDQETVLLESCVAYGPLPQLSARALAASFVRMNAPALRDAVVSGIKHLEQFRQVTASAGMAQPALWAPAAQADLAWRSGFPVEGAATLGSARNGYLSVGDAAGAALTFLIEGDWYAAPTSSPETLGLELAQQTEDSPLASARDDQRAAALYDQAEQLLAGVDAPRALAALALRRAGLAWAGERFDEQRAYLDVAERAFTEAGDAAQCQLIVVHRLLCDVARGEVATTRLTAGTGWDLQARGPMEDILRWVTERGSTSFGVGLARLLHRAGERFEAQDKLEQAGVAYSMALPLARLSRWILPSTLLEALARADARQNFTARALVRLEQALGELPAATPIQQDPEPWMQHVSLVMSILVAQSGRTGSSASGLGVAGLQRTIDRLRELLTVEGLSDGDGPTSLLRGAGALLREAARARKLASADELLTAANTRQMLDVTVQSVRAEVATMSALADLQRGRLAQRAGRTAEADQVFAATLASIDAGPAAVRWPGVLVCAAAQSEEEALRRFRQVQADGSLPADLLALLALRARDFPAATALFAGVDDASAQSWSDGLDRAELALECDDAETALSRCAAAIDRFEAEVGALGRDPDRLSMCDDVKATSLYLIAARACLELADGGDDAAIARSFELSDRARSLALANLVAGAARTTPDDDALRRRWQQSATEWSAAFERVLAVYDAGGDEHTADPSGLPTRDLTEADAALVRLEAEIESGRPGALAAARGLPASPGLGDIQRTLAPETCVLQYHVVGRDFLVWAVTATSARGGYTRLDAPGLEPLVGAVWRACSTGALGAPADALADLLFGHVENVLRGSSRVVIVPFGPLTALPFHALPFDGEPLGRRRVISTIPSASMLAGRRLDEPIADADADAVIVGDPAFDPAAHPTLPRLPGAAVEARAIGRILSATDVLVGADAGASALRPLLTDRTLVHLATHGRLDEIAPSNSSLVLAGSDRLTVADLIGLRLRAEIAVLSACNSGRGAATLGGDLIGLTRGLLAAGARRAIVSLWPVDDMAACVTMASFYEHLRDTGVAAVALAGAQTAIHAMSAADIASRYRVLAGDPGESTPAVRRGGGAPTVRHLGPDPGSADMYPLDGSAFDGRVERIWAPFILVG